MRALLGRLLRYGLVGAGLNAAGYLVYLLVTWAGAEPKATMTLLYLLGASAGYAGHRRLAFDYDGAVWASSLRYALAHACGYGINLALLFVLSDRLGVPHQLVQAGAMVTVAGFLFLAFNFFVFPQRRGEHG